MEQRRKPFRISIRTVLIAVVILLVVVTSSIAWVFGLVLTRQGVEDISASLRKYIGMHVENHVNVLLVEGAASVSFFQATSVADVRSQGTAPLMADMAHTLQIFPHINRMAFSSASLTETTTVGVKRLVNYEGLGNNLVILVPFDVPTTLYFVTNKTTNLSEWFFITNNYSVGQLVAHTNYYPCCGFSWYTLGANTPLHALTWTSVYKTPEDLTGIRVVTSVAQSGTNNSIDGVFSVSLYLVEMKTMLDSLDIGADGKLILVNANGFVIEQSCRGSDCEEPNKSSNMLISLSSIPGLYKRLAGTIQSNYGGYEAIRDGDFLELDDWWVSFSIISRENLRWILIVLLKRSYFLSAVNRAIDYTLLAHAVVLVVGLLFIILITTLITRPMKRVIKNMNNISKMEFVDAKLVGKTGGKKKFMLAENEALYEAMGRMDAALSSFEKFVPASVVRHIIATQSGATLGVQPRNITIFFSDIEDFSSVSESLEPAVLVNLIGEYLEQMSHIITNHDGTIDKFIGDAIMALWNAPRDFENHAELACNAALAMQHALAVLRGDWISRGLPPLRCRIGINTGEALVGNIGSPHRMNYTAIGDSVNLASRMEGLCKFYGVTIVISETTYYDVRNIFLCRVLDKVVVKGKSTSLFVYELMCPVATATEDQKHLCALQEQALRSLFQEKNYPAALGLLHKLLEKHPDDKGLKLLLDRCTKLVQDESFLQEWPGFYVLEEK